MTALLGKVAYPAIGAVLGFLYYKFVGCPSGACPITANPYTSTLYGLLIGLALSGAR
ncbi:MAG: YtxH domain-containing protein [Candidatus Riflebacteria bacterium]|nr:YtxH domain-containing protein [Candidatus Riflebacteria bacterium]